MQLVGNEGLFEIACYDWHLCSASDNLYFDVHAKYCTIHKEKAKETFVGTAGDFLLLTEVLLHVGSKCFAAIAFRVFGHIV